MRGFRETSCETSGLIVEAMSVTKQAVPKVVEALVSDGFIVRQPTLGILDRQRA